MEIIPLVSVIVPVYNAEDFISECLDSLIRQTYKNLEIIIIDDGSTDATRQVILEYKERYKNIIYFHQKNEGCSSAKNKGLQFARGSYIQYLDADDLLSLDKIEHQVDAIKGLDDAIAVCKTVMFEITSKKETGIEIDTDFLYSTNDSLSFILNLYGINGKNGMIQPNSFLTPKTIIDSINNWNTSLSPSPDEDGEYFCRALLRAKHIIFTEGINYYRKIPSKPSLSKQKSLAHAKGAIQSVLLKKNHILSKVNTLEVRKLFAIHLAQCAYLYTKAYPELIKEIKKEIKMLGLKKVPTHKFTGTFGIFAKVIGFWNAMYVKNKFT